MPSEEEGLVAIQDGDNHADKESKEKILKFLVTLILVIIVLAGITVMAIIVQFELRSDVLADELKLIKRAALQSDVAYERLQYLCDTFGSRFSGSQSLEDAIDWIVSEMKNDSLEVRTENITVDHWVRGPASLYMISPKNYSLPLLTLGGSISTPPNGIRAPVLVVKSWEELENRSSEAVNKIVLFNPDFVSYGVTVQYRTNCANNAARHGALAALVRSITAYSLQTPHTGALATYETGLRQIPAAAITVEDAQYMQRLQDGGEAIELLLSIEAQNLPKAISRNIIAEVKGSQKPEELVILGGHIDSWDVGQGAQDDGGGCIAAWEVLRLIVELQLFPRRTMRVVLWTNEENGGGGADQYAIIHQKEILEFTVSAFESDAGVSGPSYIGYTGPSSGYNLVKEFVKTHLSDILPSKIQNGKGGGRDIQPIMVLGVPGLSLGTTANSDPPYKYFDWHHTEADTFDKILKSDLQKSVASMAVVNFAIAQMDEKLPRD
eukprot:TRINITY_DN1589_c0_g2_i1.p1 TRINITY_DN1589_c0_g2~~TRINITY_DN1589_c0_g2_i1.p1  ORF type:complete len:494 (+),score=91.79 TRINITY_DN1589_c0_g2_i1:64-1545(+)